MRDTAVLVPAAGRGERLGFGLPKALCPLRGEPLVLHAVRRAAAAASTALVVVAAPADAVEGMREIVRHVPCDVVVVAGGQSRVESVGAAIAALGASAPALALVHDAARPLAPPSLFDAVADAVRSGHDAVVPVLPLVDTIRRVNAEGAALEVVDRAELRAVQTPQGFDVAVLRRAHAQSGTEVTDDAMLAERLGVKVHTVPGAAHAMKITHADDLAVAEVLLARESG